MLASLLAVGVVVLVLWAAATGPGTVLEGEGRDRVPLSEPTPTSQSAEAGTGEQSRTEREPREVPAWLRAVVRAVLLVLEVALLVALAWVLWRALRWAWQRWDARARPATQAEGLTGEEVRHYRNQNQNAHAHLERWENRSGRQLAPLGPYTNANDGCNGRENASPHQAKAILSHRLRHIQATIVEEKSSADVHALAR